jgi:hypothetical protein
MNPPPPPPGSTSSFLYPLDFSLLTPLPCLAFVIRYGLGAMLKDGHKHLSGLEEAVVMNLEACKQLSQITRTSLGPNGERGLLSCLSWSTLLFLHTLEGTPLQP